MAKEKTQSTEVETHHEKKRLFHLYFYDGKDGIWTQRAIKLILIWYIIDTALFYLIGAISFQVQPVLSGAILTFWFVFTLFLYNKFHYSDQLKEYFNWIYVPFVFMLAIIEETIIYFNGGGLGGQATSIANDLILAVPVFVGIAVGILIIHIKRKLTPGEFFLIGAIQGYLIEILFAGNIGFAWFLGGPALCIYGGMMACFAPKAKIQDISTKKITIDLLLGTILCFIFAILGAIIGDTIYSAIL